MDRVGGGQHIPQRMYLLLLSCLVLCQYTGPQKKQQQYNRRSQIPLTYRSRTSIFNCSVSSRSPLCTGFDTAADAGPVSEFCAAVALSLIAVLGECTIMDGEREPKGESAMIRVV